MSVPASLSLGQVETKLRQEEQMNTREIEASNEKAVLKYEIDYLDKLELKAYAVDFKNQSKFELSQFCLDLCDPIKMRSTFLTVKKRFLDNPDNLDYCLILYTCYDIGAGCRMNAKKAFQLMKRLYEKEHPIGFSLMGWEYLVGNVLHNIEADISKTYALKQRARQQTEWTSPLISLGSLLLEYSDNEADILEAVQLLTRAGDNGHSIAWSSLSEYFLFPKDCPRDLKQAKAYLERGVQEGGSFSQTQLGRLLLSAEEHAAYQFTFPQNVAESGRLLSLAAEQLNPNAMLSLGLFYVYGIEGHWDQDIKKGINLIYKAATLGGKDALEDLQKCYTNITFPENIRELIRTQIEISVEKFKQAAKLGNAVGLYNLGFCYKQGLLVKPSLKLAFRCFKKSAAYGFDDAHVALAECYENGIGVLSAPSEAFLSYRMAAKVDSNYEIPHLEYYDGIMTLKDIILPFFLENNIAPAASLSQHVIDYAFDKTMVPQYRCSTIRNSFKEFLPEFLAPISATPLENMSNNKKDNKEEVKEKEKEDINDGNKETENSAQDLSSLIADYAYPK